jgi:hypothetical protein
MNGDAPEARDQTSRFDKESGICRKTFENDSEYNFAMQILQFEKLLENGYDSCMAGNRNHFKESKAVFRIITEVMANNYSDV